MSEGALAYLATMDELAERVGLDPPSSRMDKRGPGSGRTTLLALGILDALNHGWCCILTDPEDLARAEAVRSLVLQLAKRGSLRVDEEKICVVPFKIARRIPDDGGISVYMDHFSEAASVRAFGNGVAIQPRSGDRHPAVLKAMREDQARAASAPVPAPRKARRQTRMVSIPIRKRDGSFEFEEEEIHEELEDDSTGRLGQARWIRTREVGE